MTKQSKDVYRYQPLPLQSTSFIGRTEEVTDILGKLEEEFCRLLTLTGSGGAGKTRLALAIATEKFDEYRDGAYFVSLQPLSDIKFVIPAILDALSFVPRQQSDLKMQLLDYLSDKQLLLIMDNFEHLLEGAHLLSEILQAAPDVKLLVTSREALNLKEEWVSHIYGMPFPDDDAEIDADSYGAVQLFVERAHQDQANFSFAEDHVSVIRICQLLEGMPLGIELAVTWLKSLPCAAIANEIAHNLEFMATSLRNVPERHRSMSAVFEHSWKLLSPREQEIFMKLSVFWGNFGREAAEEIAGASLRILSTLVEKSLIRVDRAGYYQIHELLRQFAAEHLAAAGSTESLYNALCIYYANFLHQREHEIGGHRQYEVTQEIAAEYENVRFAWYRIVSQRQYELVDRAIVCLDHYCTIQNTWQEQSTLIQYALNKMTPQPGETPHPV